jgi:uncharacterized damage-inducible protein DinB
MNSPYLEVLQDQWRMAHSDILEIIDNLPEEALNWVPYAGGNSIAVLVTHVLGNQLETLRTVRGQPTDRDRAAEFKVDQATAADLRVLVSEAEAVSGQLIPQITSEELDALVRRPNAPRINNRSGLYTLNHSIVHAREHVGQITLTRDLWKARSKP